MWRSLSKTKRHGFNGFVLGTVLVILFGILAIEVLAVRAP